MPSLDDRITDLIGDLFSPEVARERLRAFAKDVRAEALREAANGVHEMWENGVPAQEFAARLRLVANDAPPSAPPADVTRALARAFRMYAKGYRLTAMLVNNGLLESEALDEAGYPKLTVLGRAALSIAEGK